MGDIEIGELAGVYRETTDLRFKLKAAKGAIEEAVEITNAIACEGDEADAILTYLRNAEELMPVLMMLSENERHVAERHLR